MNTTTHDVNKTRKQIQASYKHSGCEADAKSLLGNPSSTSPAQEHEESTMAAEDNSGREKTKAEDESRAESGRERLKRHRGEMAGRVWIPDMWGQEDLLKYWIDGTAFDASLVNNTIMSARAALMQQRQPLPAAAANTHHHHHLLRRGIENRC